MSNFHFLKSHYPSLHRAATQPAPAPNPNDSPQIAVLCEKVSTMELQTPLNRTQLEILQMFKTDLSDTELLELKRVFVKYLAERSNRLAEKVWEEKGWTQEDMERLSKTHLRTPYRRLS